MLFNSLEFALFLPIVFFLYWFVFNKSVKLQNLFIVVVSYIFYGWWDKTFLLLIAFTTLCSFISGVLIEDIASQKKAKYINIANILLNLGVLGVYKYFNFFATSLVEAFAGVGITVDSKVTLDLVLPVGISFYTFQALSYSIDVYKNKMPATRDVIAFFAYVSFFPQLVAGPIERATNLLPQFAKIRTFDYPLAVIGMRQILWGFFMKLCVADRVATYVNAVFNNLENHDGLSILLACVFFSIQIYCDFAGYSLIAIGVAKLFAIELMQNFKRPYFSKSLSDFWRRWHISLSTWFKDYVYIPLGGNRVGLKKHLINLFITFLISGIWHGANWTFMIWGAIHGFFLCIEVLFQKVRIEVLLRKNSYIGFLATISIVCLAWIFFRAETIQDAVLAIEKIFTKPGHLFIDKNTMALSIISLSILFVVEFIEEYYPQKLYISILPVRYFFYLALVFLIVLNGAYNGSQFLYFQF